MLEIKKVLKVKRVLKSHGVEMQNFKVFGLETLSFFCFKQRDSAKLLGLLSSETTVDETVRVRG